MHLEQISSQITPGNSLNAFLGLANCMWQGPRNVRRRKLMQKSKGKDELGSRDGPMSAPLPKCSENRPKKASGILRGFPFEATSSVHILLGSFSP